MISDQEDTELLKQQLATLEQKLSSLRVQADEQQLQSNNLVAKHIEELTIDVNGKSENDKTELDALRQARDVAEADRGAKSEFIYTSCRDIRDTADFIQGKVSEFEVLLLAFAD